jgi:hypothetical protein
MPEIARSPQTATRDFAVVFLWPPASLDKYLFIQVRELISLDLENKRFLLRFLKKKKKKKGEYY